MARITRCNELIKFNNKWIKIDIDIRPTYLHLPFIDEKNVIIENRKVKKSSLEGWIYKTEEDIKQILEMIKESLEKKALSIWIQF